MSELVVIHESIRAKYSFDACDVDAALLMDHFAIPSGSKVLVVGAHDEPTANMLSEAGLTVYGVDLREYDSRLPPCNYTYLQHDFCDLPLSFIAEHQGTFDAVIALSCIEHFGMSTYQEGPIHPYYDVVAMRKVYEFLKPGGHAYVSVPFGGYYLEIWPHWRVYDLASVAMRLVQDLGMMNIICASSGKFQLDGREVKIRECLSVEEASKFSGIPPHVSALLILQKYPISRKGKR